MSTNHLLEAEPGDLVIITPHRLGAPEQLGEILMVLSGRAPHYLVRWDNGHESVFFPGRDATIRRRRSSQELDD